MPFDDRGFPDLPRGERAASPAVRRMVGRWLFGIAFMILVMTGLGGATRLSGSGLSIMEWAPIMGGLPPMSDTEWGRLFALYQSTSQYSLVNDGFGLEGFKRIFWLEWAHRFWGRLLGLAFAGPALWFAVTGRLERRMLPRFALFLVLGGMQGAVGWFMVASGFEPGAVAVAPVRLVLHLVLAVTLYSAILWTAFELSAPGSPPPGSPPVGAPPVGAPPVGASPVGASLSSGVADPGRAVRWLAWTTAGLTALAIAAGGFVAGLRAGLTYNSFPLMDGRLVPAGYADLTPFGRNFVENIATVQFNHRLVASLALVSALALTCVAWKHRCVLGWRALFPGVAAAGQYGLGIVTLVHAVPPVLGVAHQLGATILLTAALAIAHATRRTAALSIPAQNKQAGLSTFREPRT